MAGVGVWNGRFELDGEPFYPVGVNYAPRYVCTNFWADWRPEVIRKDLQTIAEAGFNCIRIPVIWQTAEPAPGAFSPEFERHFDEFIGWCGERGLYVMPWFLVGVSTGKYDVIYRQGRSFLSGRMLELARAHLRHFVSEYRDDRRILCWDLCDEPEFYSKFEQSDQLPYDRDIAANYVRTLAQAVREADPTHLVTLGFSHIASENWGFNVRDVAELLDVMSVTAYAYRVREPLDGFRNGYFVAWNVRFQRQAGREVFLGEAPGNTTASNAEDVVANYLKISSYSSLAAGALGVIPWVYTDYEPEAHLKWPLNGMPTEPWFGLWRADGSRKPSCDALIAFSRAMRELPITDYEPAEPGEAAVLVPESYYEEVGANFPASYMAYVLARMAGLTVDFLWERDLTGAIDYKLILAPMCHRLSLRTWNVLERWVGSGGVLFLTFGGPACYSPSFARMFGVSIRGQLPGPAPTEARMERDWHGLRAGETLAPLPQPWNAPLWRPEGAELLATYADGRPFMLVNRRGKGLAVCCSHMIEGSFLGGEVYGRWREYPGWRLYRAVAEAAGVRPQALGSDPCVETYLMKRRKGSGRLLMLLNHVGETRRTVVELAEPPASIELVGARPEGSCSLLKSQEGGSLRARLEPFGVVWVELP